MSGTPGEGEGRKGWGAQGWSQGALLGRTASATGPGRWPEKIKPASCGQTDGWRFGASSGAGVTQAWLGPLQHWHREGLNHSTNKQQRICLLCHLAHHGQAAGGSAPDRPRGSGGQAGETGSQAPGGRGGSGNEGAGEGCEGREGSPLTGERLPATGPPSG